jgi:RNA-directed DNA polymerase
MAAKECPYGYTDASAVVKGRSHPQGAVTRNGCRYATRGIISPVLANLALDGLETLLKQYLGVTRAKKLKVNVVRYADDFVITGPPGGTGERSETLGRAVPRDAGLRLSLKKTRIAHIDEGFDFLGWNFRKYDGTLLIKPSKKNVKAFYSKVREVIDTHKTVSRRI